jgi:hypothetical protein
VRQTLSKTGIRVRFSGNKYNTLSPFRRAESPHLLALRLIDELNKLFGGIEGFPPKLLADTSHRDCSSYFSARFNVQMQEAGLKLITPNCTTSWQCVLLLHCHHRHQAQNPCRRTLGIAAHRPCLFQ